MESRAQREAELEQASEEIAKKKAAHHSRNTSSDRGLGSPSFEDRPGEEEARSGRGPERGPAPRLDKRTMSTTSLVSIKSEQSTNNSNMGESNRQEYVASTLGLFLALMSRMPLIRGVMQPPSEDMVAHLKKIRVNKYCHMISCTGNFRSVWDISSLLLVLFCTFSVPYDMTFEPPKSRAASAVDMMVEAFFIIEIHLNFFTTYFDADDGTEVFHPLFIALQYASGWLPIDLVSSIPSEMVTRIYEAMGPSDDEGGGNLDILAKLRIIRILRLTKLLRLLRIKQLMEQIELSVPAMRTVFGLFRLLFMMAILAHIQACVFFLMAKLNVGNSWVSKYHAGCCDANLNFVTAAKQSLMKEEGTWEGEECFSEAEMPSLGVLYTNSIYWSFTTLTSVGYGEITPCNEYEMLYCTFGMLVGSGMFAYIVGNISEVITAVAGQKIALKSKMRSLQEYIVVRKLPKEVAMQLRYQCLHRWRKIVFSEQEVLNEFTTQIRREIVQYINKDNLTKIRFLEKLNAQADREPDLLPVVKQMSVSLATMFQPTVTNKGETIIASTNESSNEHKLQGGDMHIIMLGSFVTKRNSREHANRHVVYEMPSSVNELEMLSEIMNQECLNEEEFAHLTENLPPEFKDLNIQDLMPLPHSKIYHAETEVETLSLHKADFREAVDRTNDQDGYSILRFALVRIFTGMLLELDRVDKEIIVQKTKAKREAIEKQERRERRLAEKISGPMSVGSKRRSVASSASVRSISGNTSRRFSEDPNTAEEISGVLEKMREMNASIESQAEELKQYMQSIGLEEPQAPVPTVRTPGSGRFVSGFASA